jgi:hypothetical protein
MVSRLGLFPVPRHSEHISWWESANAVGGTAAKNTVTPRSTPFVVFMLVFLAEVELEVND